MPTQPPNAVGLLVRNRWELTKQSLDSLVACQQPNEDYDLFVIDNASDPENKKKLKRYLSQGKLPLKNAFFLETEKSIAQAYNLFLSISQDYEYRVKFDNDITLRATVVSVPKKRSGPPPPTPDEADPMAGAPRSASIVKGVRRLQKRPATLHTRFLDYMKEFHKEYKADLVALLPCTPNTPFSAMMGEVAPRTINNRSYLLGSCLMISKVAFDKLGYFDERLHRKIDIEYSQRAIKQGLNIGYHPSYWAIHIGHNQPTEEKNILQAKEELTWKLLKDEEALPVPYKSIWEKAIWKILPSAEKNIIVNLK